MNFVSSEPPRRLFRRTPIAVLVAGLMATTTVNAGVVSISDPFNFREVRVGDVGPVDDLLVGFNATDSDTGARPVGASALARNDATNEIFELRESGSSGYFARIPYSAARAGGQYSVEFTGDGFSGSAQLAAFGNGPGTGPMPVVQNLQGTGSGDTRGLSWTTPTEILNRTANDGNVDRLRVRLNGPDGGTLLDLRGLGVSSSESLTKTDFQFDPSLITRNGAYMAQLRTEGFNPFNRGAAVTSFLVDDIAGLGGTPIEIFDTYAARSRRSLNSVNWTVGDRLELTAFARDADGSEISDGTSVAATLNGLAVSLNQADEPDRQFEFSRSIGFNPSLAGPWDLTAFNGSEVASANTREVVADELMPFVRNLSITADDLTPTINWELPDNTAGVFDQVQIGLFDDVTNLRLSVFGNDQDEVLQSLSSDAQSFTFVDGQLEFGRQYVGRVVLTDLDDDGDTINRSISFFNFTPIEGQTAGPVFLPTVDGGGNFDFDFDVTANVSYAIDPFVAIGYDFETGLGDPNFATITLPDVGDGFFDLFLFDDAGNVFDSGIDLAAGSNFDFRSLDPTGGVNYAGGASRFRILGIETDAMLDPNDVTAFVANVTFADNGTFTGSMTPITQFVAEAPEPQTWLLMSAGMLLVLRRRVRRERV